MQWKNASVEASLHQSHKILASCSPVRSSFIGERSWHSDVLCQLSPRSPHVTDLRRRSIPIRPMVRCSESCGFQSYTKKICDHQLTTIYLSLKQCEFNKSIILPSIEYSVERTIVCVPIFFLPTWNVEFHGDPTRTALSAY